MGRLLSPYADFDGFVLTDGDYPLDFGEPECWLLGRDFVVEIQLPDNALELYPAGPRQRQ